MIFNKTKKTCCRLAPTALAAVIMLISAGCAQLPDNGPVVPPPPVPQEPAPPLFETYSKEEIEGLLASATGVQNVTWAPDGLAAAYMEKDAQGKWHLLVWRVGDRLPFSTQREVLDGTDAPPIPLWSPDSARVLVSAEVADGFESVTVDTDSLKISKLNEAALSPPVWSPDGTALAYGYIMDSYGESWGIIHIHSVETGKAETFFKAKGRRYDVKGWDVNNVIIYDETDEGGKTVENRAENIRPSVSGVKLHDTIDRVEAALGTDYEKTPVSHDIGHYDEAVYQLKYERGYTVTIGAESGGVLELYATAHDAVTNLGAKPGDSAEGVFALYRGRYIEPESIHGATLYGIFKVEGGAALAFYFDAPDRKFGEDIPLYSPVSGIMLTYPSVMDDSF